MYLIDLSAGFSSTGLLAAIISLFDENLELLKKSLEACMKRMSENAQYAFTILKAVQDGITGKRIEIFNKQEQLKYDPKLIDCEQYQKQLDYFLSFNNYEILSLFDFIIYLSIIILLEENRSKQIIQATFPRIGSASDARSLHLFEKERCIIDPSAIATPAMLSAIVCYYFKPFRDSIFCVLRNVTDVNDPFSKGSSLRIFDVEEDVHGFESEEKDHIAVLETNIDDTTPEIISAAMKKILNEGALDYTISPVMMKKGRIGHRIEVLCRVEDMDKMSREMILKTSTFGVRKNVVERLKLKRKIRCFQSTFGPIMVKEGYLGERLIKIAPEFDDLLRLSEEKKIEPYNLYQLIIGELNKTLVRF